MKILKKIISTLFYVLVIYFLVSSAISWWRKPSLPITPNWKMTTLANEQLDMQALSQENPLIIYFWGSWCPNCRMMSSQIQHIAIKKPTQVVSIAMQSGNDDEVNAYMQRKKLHFSVINDEGGEIAKQWQVSAVPTTIILQNGSITQSLTGYHHASEIKLRLWLLNLNN